SFDTITRLWRGDKVGSVTDRACSQCHAGSHHNDPHAKMGRCVDCHREHRGHAALIRVDDRRCVDCHADLKREDGTPPAYEPNISAFLEGKHPQFRWWSGGKLKDPGTLRFNHAVHLKEQGVLVLDTTQLAKKYAELRKKGVDPGTLTPPKKYEKLDCSDCHKTDAAGQYMEPISFEAHCRRCHPLSVQLAGAWKGPTLT